MVILGYKLLLKKSGACFLSLLSGLQHLETFDMRLFVSDILRPATLQPCAEFREEQDHHLVSISS